MHVYAKYVSMKFICIICTSHFAYGTEYARHGAHDARRCEQQPGCQWVRRMRGCTREGTGGIVRRSSLVRRGTLAQDHKLQRQGRKRRNSSELYSRQNNFTEKCTMFFRPAGLQRSGSASRAREVTPWHGGQTPVGGRFHELNRTLPAHSGSRPPFTTG